MPDNATREKRTVIIGAAGRDFHNFNVVYRDDPAVKVVAFTAAQIPGIAGRNYPAEFAGDLYPDGIPILDEKDIENIIKEKGVDECVLSYSDLSYDTVMHLGSRVMAAGAQFSMLGSDQTMIKSEKPVIAVVAVRTGCGKSQTSRRVVEILKEAGRKVASVRHPMPYGDLVKQKVQRYGTLEDMEKYDCTIEEIEEYEPHINMGSVIYAGVDYGEILRQAEQEADVIVWDGGNNDMSFYKPDVTVTVADPLRPGHETRYYPGEVNLRLADAVVINKTDTAKPEDIAAVEANVKEYNPGARIIKAESVLKVDDPEFIRGKRVLVVEDGPTLTHGDMQCGAGTEAAKRAGAAELVDPKPYAVGSIRETLEKYPGLDQLIPAMGYGDKQISDLEATINNTDCDGVVIGTPIDLARFIKIDKPATRVKYDLAEDAKAELKGLFAEKGLI